MKRGEILPVPSRLRTAFSGAGGGRSPAPFGFGDGSMIGEHRLPGGVFPFSAGSDKTAGNKIINAP